MQRQRLAQATSRLHVKSHLGGGGGAGGGGGLGGGLHGSVPSAPALAGARCSEHTHLGGSGGLGGGLGGGGSGCRRTENVGASAQAAQPWPRRHAPAVTAAETGSAAAAEAGSAAVGCTAGRLRERRVRRLRCTYGMRGSTHLGEGLRG